MKHDLKITIFLVVLFFSSQVIGLFVFSKSMDVITYYNETTGRTETSISDKEVITGRPDTQAGESFSFIMFSLLIGTALVFLIIKLHLMKVWKGWFFVAVALTLAISFSVFINDIYALVLGIILAYFKIFKPNIFTHNISEVFMYSGIAILLVPILGDPNTLVFGLIPENIFWMILLLIAISIYDAIAVWKSKHMIKMAKAQAQNKMFAGILIPYEKPKKTATIKIPIPKGMKSKEVKSAILGGGDIAFPMLFAGSVMRHLIVANNITPTTAFLRIQFIPIAVTIALFLLLSKGKKETFYPAMPFLSLGCLVGYGLILLF